MVGRINEVLYRSWIRQSGDYGIGAVNREPSGTSHQIHATLLPKDGISTLPQGNRSVPHTVASGNRSPGRPTGCETFSPSSGGILTDTGVSLYIVTSFSLEISMNTGSDIARTYGSPTPARGEMPTDTPLPIQQILSA